MLPLKPISNFGRNLQIHPTHYYEPLDERELLAILDRHRGAQIRAIGRLHSWSEAPVCSEVIINMQHFQKVEVQCDHRGSWAIVGAGCQIKVLLKHLKRQGQTLPSLGLINEQTIAGAISTGTHGSGRHSLSHYIDSVRVGRYDAVSGEVMIEEIDGGNALQAARCSLGCLGVILEVRIRCRAQYNIEEHWREYPSLDDVLRNETEFPLQQFFLIPWRWTFLVQHRREVARPRSFWANVYRWYWFLWVDVGLHLVVLLAIRLISSFRFTRFLYRYIIPYAVFRHWKVTDDSSAMLVMEHELFRHIETELFVRSQDLAAALDCVRQVLIFAGDAAQSAAASLPDTGVLADEASLNAAFRGRYCHHYPICVRRVLPDDTLISMSSDDVQVWYAISLISYARPSDRDGFFQVAAFLTETMCQRFGARPHWGKRCPLPAHDLVRLYPRFEEFVDVCESRDPAGVFRNQWARALFVENGRC